MYNAYMQLLSRKGIAIWYACPVYHINVMAKPPEVVMVNLMCSTHRQGWVRLWFHHEML